jgi:hypothetical protein
VPSCRLTEFFCAQINAKLKRRPTPKEVAAQASCPQCREDWAVDRADKAAQGNQCVFCDTCDLFIMYEPLVFKHCSVVKGDKDTAKEIESAHRSVNELTETAYVYLNRKGQGKFGIQTQGPSETELVLQTIKMMYQRAGGDDMEGAAAFFNSTFKALKQEFFALRVQWQVLYERVGILDELAMCGQRLQWWPEDATGWVKMSIMEGMS